MVCHRVAMSTVRSAIERFMPYGSSYSNIQAVKSSFMQEYFLRSWRGIRSQQNREKQRCVDGYCNAGAQRRKAQSSCRLCQSEEREGITALTMNGLAAERFARWACLSLRGSLQRFGVKLVRRRLPFDTVMLHCCSNALHRVHSERSRIGYRSILVARCKAHVDSLICKSSGMDHIDLGRRSATSQSG
jgi:hypothetical protein